MSIFRCSSCGCIENTACSGYWHWQRSNPEEAHPELCSECDPKIGKWHGRFEKQSADGLILCNDGFLYGKEDINGDRMKWRFENQGIEVVGEIDGDKVKGFNRES